MLTMVDDCTRECPAIEVDTSLGGLRVRGVLDRVAAERGLPEAIVLDNGPEFRGRALAAWSEERGCDWSSAGQTGAECLCGKLQRPATRRVLERELVHELD
jgi:transposase InsO family protein